jgi:hypothetical protein
MPVVLRTSLLIGVWLVGLGVGLAALGGVAPSSVAAGPGAVQLAAVPPAIPPGVARVWFLRQFQPDSLQMPMIYVNGAPLASSEPGTTFFRDFSPGSYAFSVETCTRDFNQVATPNLTPGSETFLEVQSLKDFRSWDCITDTFYVRAIPAERAQLYFSQLRYLGAG